MTSLDGGLYLYAGCNFPQKWDIFFSAETDQLGKTMLASGVSDSVLVVLSSAVSTVSLQGHVSVGNFMPYIEITPTQMPSFFDVIVNSSNGFQIEFLGRRFVFRALGQDGTTANEQLVKLSDYCKVEPTNVKNFCISNPTSKADECRKIYVYPENDAGDELDKYLNEQEKKDIGKKAE